MLINDTSPDTFAGPIALSNIQVRNFICTVLSSLMSLVHAQFNYIWYVTYCRPGVYTADSSYSISRQGLRGQVGFAEAVVDFSLTLAV